MLSDLRLAIKRLSSAPGFAIAAVLTLAVAVGANTAIFTIADAVLFRPLPYDDPDRLLVVRSVHEDGFRSSSVPYEYVAAIQQHHGGIAAVALRSTTIMMNHAGTEGGESLETLYAAPDYFQILGVRASRGRLFDASDVPEGPRRVMLTHESWLSRFAADERIIGREVTLGSESRIVGGVLPRGFVFPSASLWYSEATTGRAEFVMLAEPPVPADPRRQSRLTLGGMASDAIVRLKPGVTRAQAQAELDVLVASVAGSRSEKNDGRIVLDDVRAMLFPTGRQILVLLLAFAALVLLIGCANLSNMLLARTHRREREFAVQAALGAEPVRMIRQVFFETLLIGIAAGVLAAGLTLAMSDAMIREVPPVAYGRAVIGVDFRVAAFACMLGVVAGLLFAVLPAWRSARMDVHALIRGGNSRRPPRPRGLGRPMVAVQVGLAIVVIVGALSATSHFRAVVNEPLGFVSENLLAVRVQAPLEGAALRDFYQRVSATLAQRTEIAGVGAGSSRPFDRFGSADALRSERQDIRIAHVLPGYLETLGVRIREGHLPRANWSASGLEPAVITRSAAAKLFPGGRALGEVVPLQGRSVAVVAIIDDVVTDFDDRPSWIYITPRDSTRFSTIIVRTRTRSAAVLADVRRQIASFLPPSAPITARWLDDSIRSHSAYRNPRFQTVVLGGFSILALGLSALGIFAVVAATVAMRTREMGVRIAVGASPADLVRLIVRETSIPVGAGIVAGVLATRLLSGIAQSQVAGFSAIDAGSFVVAALVVLVAGLLAVYVPARRAGRVDPIVVLRAE